MQIISVAQQKGGTGKTTTAAAIGAGLAKRGKRILFIDLDAQSNLTTTLHPERGSITALDVLTGKASAKDAAQPITAIKGAAIIPGTPYLAGADATITGERRQFRLADALGEVATDYDFCIVDTPPALGMLTVNALTAADRVIIPCMADVFSIQAIQQIAATIAGIRKATNPRLEIAGIVLTRYNARQVLTRDLAQAIEQTAANMGTKVFNSRIRESVAIREAQAMGQTIFEYSARSNGAKDYDQLIKELV